MTNAEYAQGLRDLAAFYDAHPLAAQPYQSEGINYFPAEKAEVAAGIREWGGHWDKEVSHGLLYVTRPFGPFMLRIIIDQEAVCTARVVGYEDVPEQPAKPAYQRKVLEWDCHSVIAEGPTSHRESAILPSHAVAPCPPE